MNFLASSRLLRAVLWADVASCAGCAALHLGVASRLAGWFGLPVGLLVGSGLALLGFVAFAAWLASRPRPPRRGVQALALANGAWVLGCLALLVTGAAGTGMGQAWLVLQAVAVGVLAELQWLAVRRGQAVQPA